MHSGNGKSVLNRARSLLCCPALKRRGNNSSEKYFRFSRSLTLHTPSYALTPFWRWKFFLYLFSVDRRWLSALSIDTACGMRRRKKMCKKWTEVLLLSAENMLKNRSYSSIRFVPLWLRSFLVSLHSSSFVLYTFHLDETTASTQSSRFSLSFTLIEVHRSAVITDRTEEWQSWSKGARTFIKC